MTVLLIAPASPAQCARWLRVALFAALLVGSGLAARAQGDAALASDRAAVAPPAPAERQLQRERIARELALADALHRSEQAGCAQRFAETDCLRDAQQRYNRTRADLRRQEVLLNDEAREQRVDTRRDDQAGRAQRAEQRDAQAARRAAQAEQRRADASEKALSAQQRGAAAGTRPASLPLPP